MSTNEVIIITEEADGTTTIVDVIETTPDDAAQLTADNNESLAEQVIETILGHEIDFDANDEMSETYQVASGDAEIMQDNQDAFLPAEDFAATVAATEFSGGYTGAASSSTDAATEGEVATDTQAQAHIDAARDAQEQADAAIAVGDYETAAQLREDAENEAYAASDNSMLHGSDSNDLYLADNQHDKAEDLQQQQAQYAASGDYEAARDAAGDAATYQQWADGNAGGADHSGQAEQEQAQEDWAAWHQDIAEDNQNSADAYAAYGDADGAAVYQDVANDHQEVADDYGAAGAYDATYDTSDATYTADTSYDSSYSAADTSASYDSE